MVCPSCGSLVGVNDERCYTCGRVNPGMWGFAPLVRRFGTDLGLGPLVIGGCVVMYVVTVLLGMRFSGAADVMSSNYAALMVLGASGNGPVFGGGRWWTVLSASWLHGGLLHLLMNMLSVRSLASGTASILGPSRTVVVYVLSGVCGFAVSSLMGSGVTVGASASNLRLDWRARALRPPERQQSDLQPGDSVGDRDPRLGLHLSADRQLRRTPAASSAAISRRQR
ncbi:MAG: rhomboid family intramembrane serine protease [Vicinamibacterales bacterium]